MAKKIGVDAGVLIYMGFINTLLESIKQPENKRSVFEKVLVLKKPIEEKFKIRIEKAPTGLLEVRGDVPPQARKLFYELFLSMVRSLEDRYGAYNTWSKLTPKIHPVYAQHQQEIIELDLEVPLSKFELDFMIQGTLSKSWIFKTFFGVIGEGKWSKGVALVTNKRIIIRSDSSSSEINVKDILTVGREVYSDVALKYSSRSVKMIDYKTTLGIAALMYEGSPDVLMEFNKLVSRVRVEAKGLTPIEKKVLVVLDRRQPLTSLLAHGDVDKKTLGRALARLRQIDYLTGDYELTSYGLNALSGVLRQQSV